MQRKGTWIKKTQAHISSTRLDTYHSLTVFIPWTRCKAVKYLVSPIITSVRMSHEGRFWLTRIPTHAWNQNDWYGLLSSPRSSKPNTVSRRSVNGFVELTMIQNALNESIWGKVWHENSSREDTYSLGVYPEPLLDKPIHTTPHMRKRIHLTKNGLLEAKGLCNNVHSEKKCEI